MNISDSVDLSIVRGESSWNYIYIMLGFVIAIEGTIIQMITPICFPYNIITFVLVSIISFWLFLFNGWFQNKLIGIKAKYEGKAR